MSKIMFPPGARVPATLSARALLAGVLFLSTAPGAYAAPAADATVSAAPAPADATDDSDMSAITVTARNRSEDIRDVPIPISVISSEQLAQQRVFTIADISQRAPGLTATTPNARRTGVSIRGIGKTSGNDNMEAAVGVIVDDVFLGHVGMTYQDFTDLQQVEILRGPQGTLLGKNTSLGVIKYTSKQPTFHPEGTLELEGGLSKEAWKARGSFSDKLIDDVLAFRVSAFYDKQAGDLLNINPAVGGRWHETNRWGGRAQLLFQPSANLSFKLNADYAATHENSNTKPFMVDPKTLNDGSVRSISYTSRLARSYFGGYQPVIGSWDTIDLNEALPLVTRNWGVSLVAKVEGGPIEVTSITAYRKLHFDATNDSDQTRFSISRGGTLVDTNQLSQELRFAGKLGSTLDFQAGVYLFKIVTGSTSRNAFGADAGAFYASDAQYAKLSSAALQPLLQASLANIRQWTYQHPVTTSEAGFGQVNWKPFDRFTLTAGLRVTSEQKTNYVWKSSAYTNGGALVPTGNATADAIRAAQLGSDYATTLGTPINATSVAWLVNPSYKLTDNVLLFASASKGSKSGAVSFDSNGARSNVLPEQTFDVELGVKGSFFDRHLWLSANLYLTNVRNYQATTSIVDPTSPTGYSSHLGNIPGIHARGVEFDGTLEVAKGFVINFAGAYNHAVYSDWSIATCPRSYPSSVPVCNNTGRQIVGAPRWSTVIGFTYERDLPGLGVGLKAFVNDSFHSGQNLEQLLSPYGWQPSYHLTDVGLGFTHPFGAAKAEISVVAKNVFDTHYTTSVNDFSNSSPVGYDGIGSRRYVGVVARTQF